MADARYRREGPRPGWGKLSRDSRGAVVWEANVSRDDSRTGRAGQARREVYEGCCRGTLRVGKAKTAARPTTNDTLACDNR